MAGLLAPPLMREMMRDLRFEEREREVTESHAGRCWMADVDVSEDEAAELKGRTLLNGLGTLILVPITEYSSCMKEEANESMLSCVCVVTRAASAAAAAACCCAAERCVAEDGVIDEEEEEPVDAAVIERAFAMVSSARMRSWRNDIPRPAVGKKERGRESWLVDIKIKRYR